MENTDGTPSDLLIIPKIQLKLHRLQSIFICLSCPISSTPTLPQDIFILLVNKPLLGAYYCGFFCCYWVASVVQVLPRPWEAHNSHPTLKILCQVHKASPKSHILYDSIYKKFPE